MRFARSGSWLPRSIAALALLLASAVPASAGGGSVALGSGESRVLAGGGAHVCTTVVSHGEPATLIVRGPLGIRTISLGSRSRHCARDVELLALECESPSRRCSASYQVEDF